ncbi:flagellar hook protein FlgE [Caminicella sporogenes]|uniref:flagellar hook protein FlgE n=1 Tax=Caminicella sporogenes TaxID=166485 RepID=UPI0025426981|nr:flagellar hook protein FlgE [Caminicella sporogenes]WIF94641.1 flagellar hook protein FlgE [Caminicella sporogenes]
MMRSMNSAVSALKAHQAKMDVIGNNIANINTVGFKAGRVTFKEVLSQTIKGASANQGGRSGTNPQQIGLGINIGSIDTIHTRGSVDRTDVPTDVMINGDGFFIVSDDENFLNRSYTRAGNFSIDSMGNLNLGGYRVLGYRIEDGTIGETPKFKTTLEGLVISKAMTFPAQVTGISKPASTQQSTERDVIIEGNIDADLGLDASITVKDTNNDGTADEWLVPPSKLMTNPQFITVYDELGGEHELKLTFRRKMKVKYDWDSGEISDFSNGDNPKIEEAIEPNKWELVIEAVNSTEAIDVNAAGSPEQKYIVDNITFTDGKVDLSKINIELSTTDKDNDTFPNGAGTFNFNLSFEDENGDKLLKQFSSDSTIHLQTLTGYKQGKLDSFSIGEDGIITGSFTNGKTSAIGRIALAKFKNPEGLQKTQENLFIDTANSGNPIIGKPGSGGFATLIPGALEMSNVDLAKEFTTMITTQRGFQANSRVITTTDEMLQELVNLKR